MGQKMNGTQVATATEVREKVEKIFFWAGADGNY